MTDGYGRKLPWKKEARRAAHAGEPTLRNFLRQDPPRNDTGFKLLKYIHEELLKGSSDDDDLFHCFFGALHYVQNPLQYYDFSDHDRRSRPAINQDFSAYGLLIQSAEQDRQSAREKYSTSPLTQLIWKYTKDELYCTGAISVCARYGLDGLLQQVLNELKSKHTDLVEQFELLFQIPKGLELTPLGLAISYRNVICLNTLRWSIDAKRFAKHVFDNQDVVMAGKLRVPLLHWTLRQIEVGVRDAPNFDDSFAVDANLLESIIRIEPRLLTQRDDDEGLTPLALALRIQDSIRETTAQQQYDGLETIIRNGIYNQLRSPDDWRNALYSRSGRVHQDHPGKEVSLDLSDFNHGSEFFINFVNDLETFKKEWEFESTLLYLILPTLRTYDEHNHLAKFLRWLKAKGVRRIMKLKLPDSDRRYTHHFVYQHIFCLYEIDEFDWVRLDLNLDGFGSKPLWMGITNLWVQQQCGGFQENAHSTLLRESMSTRQPKLLDLTDEQTEKLILNIVKPSLQEFPEFNEVKAGEFRDNLCKAAIDAKNSPSETAVLEKGTRILSWEEFTYQSKPPTQQIGCEFKLLTDMKPCHEFLSSLRKMRRSGDDRTNHCLRVLHDSTKRVKIAIIDNGADQTCETICGNIVRGASFVENPSEPGSILPWYTPIDAHGTQMADLICRVNPCCELFPIRVASLRKDVDVGAAVKAIEWALENKVDIISVSWIVRKSVADADEFEKAISKATEAKVLVVCATADVGAHSAGDLWPANLQNVIAVSASNALGLPMPWSHLDVHAMLEGDKVRTRGPRYMRLDENAHESGSSVSTALAAGVASLCLFLARMANENEDAEKFKRRKVMLAVFRRMQVSDNDKVMELSRLFGSEFKCSHAFQMGRSEPPKGLEKFLWRDYQDLYHRDPVLRNRIGFTRRANSPAP